MRKVVGLAILATVLMAGFGACSNKAPSPDDPTLKQNVWDKTKAGGATGDMRTTPPPPPAAGK